MPFPHVVSEIGAEKHERFNDMFIDRSFGDIEFPEICSYVMPLNRLIRKICCRRGGRSSTPAKEGIGKLLISPVVQPGSVRHVPFHPPAPHRAVAAFF